MMNPTLESITNFLSSHNLPYEVNSACAAIRTYVRAKNLEYLAIIFQLSPDGNLLHVELPDLLYIKEHVYKGVIFQTLLSFLSECRLLRFAYSPNSGEVYASLDLFLTENAQLTQEQLNLYLSNLLYLVDELAMPRLKQVLATGEDPGLTSTNTSHS